MRLSPAEYVIRLLGGVRKTARTIGRSPSSVSKWTKSRDVKGSEGNIPSAAQRAILQKAQDLGLDITPADLMLGRDVPEPAASCDNHTMRMRA